MTTMNQFIGSSAAMQRRSIVMVGLMGAGKSSIGRRLAVRLALPFFDADTEIEAAAGMTVSDIFTLHGESAFRDVERKVMARLLDGEAKVIATGGGAFLDEATQRLVREKSISLWLKADLDTLIRRTEGRNHRPLLLSGDPRQILGDLIAKRYPVYTEADLTVQTGDQPHDEVVEAVVTALENYASSRRHVRVDLGARGYDILIGPGLIEKAGELIAPLTKSKRVFIVTDDHVALYHLERLKQSLDRASITYDLHILPAGESSKDFAHLEALLDAMLAARLERSTLVIALGGGVIGDLAGFAAAIAMRGVDFVQIPTTLLSQVDSSVGGKTGINTKRGKNLVGAFHQPRLVLADSEVLSTLPLREVRSGYAEVAKYGLIDDAPFFTWLENRGAEICRLEPEPLSKAIAASCAAKARVVGADEREAGLRALLNLGHTFGHALEAETGYGEKLNHGEAVSIGMVLAFDLSVRLGLCSPGDATRVKDHLKSVGLPISPLDVAGQEWNIEALLGHMVLDKKVKDGRAVFILARGIGQSFIHEAVPMEEVRATLEKAITRSC
jgi:shikimate kinase/3-dehydroquinate synthase